MAFCRSPSPILWLWSVALWCCLLSNGGIAASPPGAPGVQPNLLYYVISNGTESYLKNRNDVLDHLSRNTPLTNSSTKITGSSPDIVYGFAQCYNNTQSDCGWCITNIVLARFQQSCPLAVGAQMWYNDTQHNCYVRYDNYNFLPESPPEARSDGEQPNNVYCSDMNTNAGSLYLKNHNDVLDDLYQKTPLTDSSSYTYGSSPDTVNGFAQCYNLTKTECGECFLIVRLQFQLKCPLAVGAHMYRTTYHTDNRCLVRYENLNVLHLSYTAAPDILPESKGSKSNRTKIFVGIVMPFLALLLTALAAYFILYKRKKQGGSNQRLRDAFEGNLRLTRAYRYEELQAATEKFAKHNKLGQGGFGTVYKGILANGREVAVKKLLPASHTCTGNDEFVNEVSIISIIRHLNLVKLEGYCLEGLQRMLVLEFIVNGNLGDALFGRTIELNWPSRYDIILGVARGLAYLHEESHIQIIHRDIKASNILLDGELNPKISDFGISKLFDRERDSTSSTRIAGTYGYLAPEYAMRGRLTTKADVFSFGVLVLEIVSGRRASDLSLPDEEELLVEWAWKLYSDGLLDTLIEPRLDLTDTWKAEALKALNIAQLCTQSDANGRPAMSQVVAMLLDHLAIPAIPTVAPTYFGRTNQRSNSSTTTSIMTRSAAQSSVSWASDETTLTPR